MKKMLAGFIVLVLGASVAQAALWGGTWGGATYTSITDPNDGLGAKDITQLESIYGNGGSGVGYYFRMTLAASSPANNVYMLNFNTDGNLGTGANSSDSFYLGAGLKGIEVIVDSHFGTFLDGSHLHNYVDGGLLDNIKFNAQNLSAAGGAFSYAGSELEWYVPSATALAGATLRGSSVEIGEAFEGLDATVTHDLTDGIQVIPEPTSLALLALGVAALGLRRKVRA